jgi:hypothetical protein
LIHSASAAGADSALGNFLGENPGLTKICVTLLTLALPIAAAWAMEWGFGRLYLAWHWRRARRNHERQAAQLDRARKQSEAAKEKLRCRLQAIQDQCAEWSQAQEQFHRLGKRIRARRLPLWLLIFKIAATAAALFALCALCEPLVGWLVADFGLRVVVLLTAWLGVSGLAGARLWQGWDRPSPRQLFRERAVIWRSEALEPDASALAPQDENSWGRFPTCPTNFRRKKYVEQDHHRCLCCHSVIAGRIAERVPVEKEARTTHLHHRSDGFGRTASAGGMLLRTAIGVQTVATGQFVDDHSGDL